MLRKLLLGLLIFCSANGDIKYDATVWDQHFYTYPMHQFLNQDEYNKLIAQVILMYIQCFNSGVYGKQIRNQVESYLKTLKTPTSLRLLEDLTKVWN